MHREGDERPRHVKGPPRGDDTAVMMHGDDTVGSAVGGDGSRTAGVLDEAPCPASSADAVRVQRELHELPLPALRRRRRLLAEELVRVEHWSRLVRARRDLLVATAVRPEDLTVPVEAGACGGPLEHHFSAAPPGGALAAVGAAAEALLPVLTVGTADPGHALRGLVLDAAATGSGELPEHLHELAAAGRRLDAYEDALTAELALATDVLLERYEALFGARPA